MNRIAATSQKHARITDSGNTSESLIDHIWTSEPLKPVTGKVAGISDHVGIYAALPKMDAIPKLNPIVGRSFKNYDPISARNDFQDSLQKTDFDLEVTKGNVNTASELFV